MRDVHARPALCHSAGSLCRRSIELRSGCEHSRLDRRRHRESRDAHSFSDERTSPSDQHYIRMLVGRISQVGPPDIHG